MLLGMTTETADLARPVRPATSPPLRGVVAALAASLLFAVRAFRAYQRSV